MSVLLPPIPGERPLAPTRLTWPDVAVIALVLGFIGFETMCLAVPVHEAAIIAVCTVSAVIFALLTPKAIGQLLRGLQELNKHLHPQPTSVAGAAAGAAGAGLSAQASPPTDARDRQ